MIRALAAILLVLPLWASAADGLVYGPCWDGRYYSGTDATACPPELTSPAGGSDISATTSGASVASSTDSGTLYMCYAPTTVAGTCPTPPSYARMLAGDGDGFSCSSIADPVVGENQFSLSSLSPSTEYCTWYLQVDDRGFPHSYLADVGDYIVESEPWSTLASAPETGPGADLDTLNALFVDSATGSDSNACTSSAAPCATLGGAWGKTHTAGQDIYLKAGTGPYDSNSTTRTVNWAGSPTDPVVIGCYYFDAGQATSCREGEGANAQTLPSIRGGVTDACRAANNCDYVPSMFAKKISIQRDYVTVQDLRLYDTLGRGIEVDGDFNSGSSVTGIRLQGLQIHDTGRSAIGLQDGVTLSVVRDNEVYNANWCNMQRELNSSYTACNDWPAAIFLDESQHVLVENNDVYQSYTEGIGVYFGSSYVIVRGNRIGQLHSDNIYSDTSQNVIFEHNVLWGVPEGDPYYVRNDASRTAFVAMNFFFESQFDSNPAALAPTGHVARNNIAIGRGDCVQIGTQTAGIKDVQLHAYGNTCIGQFVRAIDFDGGAVTNAQFLTSGSGSNIVWPGTAAVCASEAAPAHDYNYWLSTPTDTDCQGANDATGVPGFSSGLTVAQFQALVYETQPDIDDVRLSASSDAVGAGDPSLETAVLLDHTDWLIFDEMSYPFAPVAANWEKTLYYDFEGTARDASAPNMGAVEGSVP